MRLLRSPWGRVIAVALGLGVVTLLVLHEGSERVLRAALRAAPILPLIVLFELAIQSCDVLAIRTLYGKQGRELPWGLLARAGFLGYSMISLVPAGRAAAEAARAALFAPRVGGPRAAVVALQIQGAALTANCATSSLCAVAAAQLSNGRGLMLATLANALATGVGAAAILLGGKLPLGSFLGRLFPRAHGFGAAFDRETRIAEPRLLPAIGIELLGRVFQISENAVLVVAVGGLFGLTPALLSEAIHLVGVTVGELIPAQLGGTESQFALFAGPLGLTRGSAMAIGITAHLAQISLLVISLLALLMWPADGKRESIPVQTDHLREAS